MKIAVGTQNKAKIIAVSRGAREYLSGPLEVAGFSVESGVSDQPMGEDETFKGAVNRATLALESDPEADIAIGLEGGLLEVGGRLVDIGIVYVLGRNGVNGLAMSQGVTIPDKLAYRITSGQELSEAVAEVYGADTINDRDCSGVITAGRLGVVEYYAQPVALALHDYMQNQRSENEQALAS